jgi:hypothetical protein
LLGHAIANSKFPWGSHVWKQENCSINEASDRLIALTFQSIHQSTVWAPFDP